MLSIIGFVFIIVVTIFAYKTAKDYERNAAGWALISIAAGLGFQIVLPIVLVFVTALIMTVSGSAVEEIQETIPIVTIGVLGIILSVVAGFLILRHLSNVPDEPLFEAPPAPPSDFNQNS